MTAVETTFDQLWDGLLAIGHDSANGGYRRLAWTDADRECREWFVEQATRRQMTFETDRNGNQWAWWGDPGGRNAVVTGSHLDSVPGGGAFDGALGVVSGFAAVDLLRGRGVEPRCPIAVVSFVEEEGARFGTACVGSRLLTGALAPELARALVDAGGVSLEQAMRRAGVAPEELGRDDARLERIRAFVEVHIEQGRFLVHQGAAVGVAAEIWPHGRYRFDLVGEANHAGTTLLADRHDPVIDFARAVLAARAAAHRHGGFATFGRLHVEPNATNAIASLVRAWLDARARDEPRVTAIVEEVAAAAAVVPERESWAPAVAFDSELRARLSDVLAAPPIATAAGHDAAVLAAAGVRAAMVFTRNVSGISHSPLEHASRADCLAGTEALAKALEELSRR
jgi:beta-ureidopropionase / N-carbamoyl-L-amino-acid hydrolase